MITLIIDPIFETLHKNTYAGVQDPAILSLAQNMYKLSVELKNRQKNETLNPPEIEFYHLAVQEFHTIYDGKNVTNKDLETIFK